jgi:uncharacterized protein (TIGR02266 family)
MALIMSNATNANAASAVYSAKSAREELAKGLSALQGDAQVPPQLLELAAPIAQSMGALHQIERSGGAELKPHADVALSNVRAALAQLQAQPPSHPAVARAMEAVASSLSHVHALSKMAAQPAPAPAPAYNPPQQPSHQPVAAFAATVAEPSRPGPSGYGGGGFPPSGGPPIGPLGTVAQAPYVPPPQPGAPSYSQPVARPVAHAAPAPQPSPPYQPPQQQQQQAAAVPQTPLRASNPVPAPPLEKGLQLVNADLGAHSPTNFYKGLAGNDIIDHGGLFVSTYMVPKIGTNVRLKVSLPGGYEFEANGVVRWAREAMGPGDAPPGFGAQFTQISPEARQLVYRYVRNREPLFYDDL